MDFVLFNYLHLAGVLGLFLALGVLATSENASSRKLGGILHAIGLLVIFISGMGMLGMAKYGFPWWVIIKLVLWLALGAMLSVAKRQLLPRAAILGLVLILGLVSVWLCIYGKVLVGA